MVARACPGTAPAALAAGSGGGAWGAPDPAGRRREDLVTFCVTWPAHRGLWFPPCDRGPLLRELCHRSYARMQALADRKGAPMAYSGHVEPGGPAISRRVSLAGGAVVEIRKLSVGSMDNNVYVLLDEQSGRVLVIDAADEAERILAELDGHEVAGIVTTHGHRDHWQALAQVAQATGAPTWLHEADTERVPMVTTHAAEDGERIAFGAAEVTIMHTPGHTEGSVCLLLEGVTATDGAGRYQLFSGDTLFPGGPGRTTSPEAFRQIMASLEQRIFGLPDDTWVYPGHGDDTTLGAERPHLDQWRSRGW